MLANVIAALGLLICVLMAIDMALPARARQAWRQWVRRPSHSNRLKAFSFSLGSRFNSRERRRAAHDAARDAIARAKHRADQWDGNVYHGEDFKQRRKPH